MAATGTAAAAPAAARHKGDWSVSGTAAWAGAAAKRWRPARVCGGGGSRRQGGARMGTADERTDNEWMFLSCGAAGVAGGGIMCNGARGRSREVHSAGCSFIGTQGGEGGGGTLGAAAGSGLSWADRLAQLGGSSWGCRRRHSCAVLRSLRCAVHAALTGASQTRAAAGPALPGSAPQGAP